MKHPSLPLRPAASAARTAGRLSRLLGRGGGTTLPGLLLNRLRPQATAELARAVPDGVILLSGTNGKTTTARLIRAALDASGAQVAANTAGSNLQRGVATALLDAEAPDIALFEVDEAVLPNLVEQTRPRVVVLMNLFRDQLDRYGELEHLAHRWRSMIADLEPGTTLVYNADDPALAEIAADHPDSVAYGIEDPRQGREALPHAADNTDCRRCGSPLQYQMITIGHLGQWACPSCGLTRPQPDVKAVNVELNGMDGQQMAVAGPSGRLEISLLLPGLPNTYNAVAAVATALAVGVAPATISGALAERGAAFGRAEHIDVGTRRVTTLLAKNPAGANENIRMVLNDNRPLHLLLLLNDRTADGQDVSWIWDVDYELLLEGDRPASLTLGGTRAHDLALRFRYATGGPADFSVVPEPAAAFDAALAACGPDGRVYVLPTYTAMLDLRRVLADRGLVPEFWEDE
ncbi:MAG: MurT ligase domain-containing protein [Acidimicrobiaceae bacterium]|nr:MurT ligase domain-containing protein [Acidimicrobiaceae bacterium]